MIFVTLISIIILAEGLYYNHVNLELKSAIKLHLSQEVIKEKAQTAALSAVALLISLAVMIFAISVL